MSSERSGAANILPRMPNMRTLSMRSIWLMAPVTHAPAARWLPISLSSLVSGQATSFEMLILQIDNLRIIDLSSCPFGFLDANLSDQLRFPSLLEVKFDIVGSLLSSYEEISGSIKSHLPILDSRGIVKVHRE